ncbi:hypothetical protein CEP53_003924 [Fusarium sp. AF-6]|nr:hypothetical protein CEP53_003924 [Fusarium sp. AF-6]
MGDPPTEQLDIDLEMAPTKVEDRRAVLATDTTEQHNNVSPNADRPSGNRQQPYAALTEAAFTSAMEAYRTFHKEPGEIDSDDYMMVLAGMLTELDNKRFQLKAAQGSGTETADGNARHVVPSAAEISFFEAKIAHVLVSGAQFSPAGVRTEEESKTRLSFLVRFTMAIFGGAALVVPILIMSLRPSKLTGLLTTSLFVVGVAVALAWFYEGCWT